MKKNKTIILLSICLLFTCLHAFANGETKVKIKGAFGIKIGEKYENKNAIQISKNQYKIEPAEVPFRNFTKCQYTTTYKEKQVYLIYATYKAESIRKAIHELRILEKLLTEKYRTEPEISTKEGIQRIIIFRNGNRYIHAYRQDEIIKITYRDIKLQEKAKEEEIEKEKKDTNTRGI